MPFKLLKQIITHLRKEVKCPSCKRAVSEESICVIATAPGVATQWSSMGLFMIVCDKCFGQSFVMVEATSVMSQLKNSIKIRSKMTGQKITMNEVLDMHNFLEKWDGDLKELFADR